MGEWFALFYVLRIEDEKKSPGSMPKKPKNNGRLDNKDDGNAKSGEGARKGRVSAY